MNKLILFTCWSFLLVPALTAQDGADQLGSRVFTSEDVSLSVSAFLQGRYTLTAVEKGPRAQTFDVPLGRIALSGDVIGHGASYFLQFEGSTLGNNNRLSLLDAWVQLQTGAGTNVQVGRMLVPYSRQFYTHPGQLLFADLSEADYAFNLPRTLGATFSGKWKRLSYSTLAGNSVRALDASGQQNSGTAVSVVGRLEVDLLRPYGYMESIPRGVSRPQWSIGFAAGRNRVVDGSSFQNLTPGDRTANFTIDSGFRINRWTTQAAVYARKADPNGAIAARLDRGAYAQIGFLIVPGKWEIAARHAIVAFDNRPGGNLAASIREYTGGVNRYILGHKLKLQFDAGMLDQRTFAGISTKGLRARAQAQILF
jgi:hypothetical protein